jgi:hypothetical protein
MRNGTSSHFEISTIPCAPTLGNTVYKSKLNAIDADQDEQDLMDDEDDEEEFNRQKERDDVDDDEEEEDDLDSDDM